jgi:hypothetical protein
MKFIKMFVFMLSLSAISLSLAQDSIVYKTIVEMNNLQDSNYLPLSKGNGWQFMYQTHDYYNQTSTSRLYSIKVIDTVSVSNRLYYKINQDANQYYVRIDRVNNKVYKTNSITPVNETVLFDFNLPNGSPYLQGDQIVNAYNSGYEKGYTSDGGSRSLFVSKNIGFYNIHDFSTLEYIDITLIDALIKDSGFSYFVRDPHYDPIFDVHSLPNTIDRNLWHIHFEYWQHLIVHGYLLDSLTMQSYYKKGNDSIPNALIELSQDIFRRETDTTITLDSSLLSQNYKFYYRFELKNKYIVPMRFYYPQSGYNCLSSLMDVKNENMQDMRYSLEQNYPNPFNPSTNIKYYVPFESKVNITVYNALGSKVKELVNSNQAQGNYEVKFDGTGLASGIYFVTLKAASINGRDSFTSSKKMILVK